jgi:hypothetical protein
VGAKTRYSQIIERIFFNYYTEGAREIQFERSDIEHVAAELGIELPKNLGDVVYSFRYRATLPESIRAKAPEGEVWIIRPAGRALYKFVSILNHPLVPNPLLAQTKVPDATPGIVVRYSLNDEQALLAKVRYNRLIDIFSGVTCYSLQNHLRTTVVEMGQVETDEIYVGIERHGVQYVFPVQAKGGTDKLSIVQIEQDFAVCAQKFPDLVCRAIAAQFMENDTIALFGFENSNDGVSLVDEKHYRLVAPDEVTEDDLRAYRERISTAS